MANTKQQQKIVFDCSQEKLLETVRNLYTQIELHSYHLGADRRDVYGYTQLQVDKERSLSFDELSTHGIPSHAKGAVTFEKIGYIQIGKINADVSTLAVRSDNLELLQFFDELAERLESYLPTRNANSQTAQVGAAKSKKTGKVFLSNKALWKEIGFFYRSSEYKTAKHGIEHMRKKHPKFKKSEKTMDKIIKDGLSGIYD